MSVSLVDRSLQLDVLVERQDRAFEDNICIRIVEDCDDQEKLFREDIISIYITPEEASLLVLELERALAASRKLRRNK